MDHLNLEPAARQKHQRLTNIEHVQIRNLRDLNLTYQQIADRLQISKSRVSYSLTKRKLFPANRKGRRIYLTNAQVDEIESFIQSSNVARQMSYLELSLNPFRHLNCGEGSIRAALERRGYKRCRVTTRFQPGRVNNKKESIGQKLKSAGEKGGLQRWETRIENNRGTNSLISWNNIERNNRNRRVSAENGVEEIDRENRDDIRGQKFEIFNNERVWEDAQRSEIAAGDKIPIEDGG